MVLSSHLATLETRRYLSPLAHLVGAYKCYPVFPGKSRNLAHMVAQGPVTVAIEVDHVIDVRRGQGFYLTMVRLTVHENPEETRGSDDRSWGNRHWQWNQQPPHLSFFWVRDREQINLVITLPITQKPLYSSLFSSTHPTPVANNTRSEQPAPPQLSMGCFGYTGF